MKDVGFRIKKIREYNNVSQEDLSTLLEVSQSNLSKIENGRIQKIDYRFLKKISNVFEIEIDDLVNNDFKLESYPKKEITTLSRFTYTSFLCYSFSKLSDMSFILCA